MNLRALQDFFSKNCIFLDTILFCCFAQVRHCIFVSFFLYNIAQYNIAQYFLWQMKPFPLGCSQLPSGLSWQNLFLSPAGPRSPGLILAKSLAAPRWSDIPGAYSDKISFCAPMSQYRRGLFWQNPYLRPDIPVSTGLITAKSLSVPRCTKVEGIIDLILSHIPAFASSAGYR